MSSSDSIIIRFRSHGDRDGATVARLAGLSPAHVLQSSICNVDVLGWIVCVGVVLVTVLFVAQFWDY